MSLLRPGITGFNSLAKVDVSTFKSAIHTVARMQNAIVSSFAVAAGNTPSFHRAELVFASHSIVVLCNAHFPVVAFADRIDGTKINCFLSPSEAIARTFADSGFEVPDASELNRRLGPMDLAALSPAEVREARYWKPLRLGDVVYNWWD